MALNIVCGIDRMLDTVAYNPTRTDVIRGSGEFDRLSGEADTGRARDDMATVSQCWQILPCPLFW